MATVADPWAGNRLHRVQCAPRQAADRITPIVAAARMTAACHRIRRGLGGSPLVPCSRKGSVAQRKTISEPPPPGSIPPIGDENSERESVPFGPAPTPAVTIQLRAKPGRLDPGGAKPVKRRSAVTLVAAAPISEKAICQKAEGIAI